MSINYKQGNLFAEAVDALVNPVNTVGVMGKGLALQFKKRYPLNFQLYRKAYQTGELKVGKMLVTKIETETSEPILPKYIINFPTKEHWRSKSKIEYIESGLEDLVQTIEDYNISSIALPALGCGWGGLKWEEVKVLIEEKLGTIAEEVDVVVFEPK